MELLTAFLAGYASLGPRGPWIGDAFLAGLNAPGLPASMQVALVWTCSYDVREEGSSVVFDVSLLGPDGAGLPVQNSRVAGTLGGNPSTPPNMPYRFESVATNLTIEVHAEGLHSFHIRTGAGELGQVPCWVQRVA